MNEMYMLPKQVRERQHTLTTGWKGGRDNGPFLCKAGKTREFGTCIWETSRKGR